MTDGLQVMIKCLNLTRSEICQNRLVTRWQAMTGYLASSKEVSKTGDSLELDARYSRVLINCVRTASLKRGRDARGALWGVTM